jgi:hypothetical protein
MKIGHLLGVLIPKQDFGFVLVVVPKAPSPALSQSYQGITAHLHSTFLSNQAITGC